MSLEHHELAAIEHCFENLLERYMDCKGLHDDRDIPDAVVESLWKAAESDVYARCD